MNCPYSARDGRINHRALSGSPVGSFRALLHCYLSPFRTSYVHFVHFRQFIRSLPCHIFILQCAQEVSFAGPRRSQGQQECKTSNWKDIGASRIKSKWTLFREGWVTNSVTPKQIALMRYTGISANSTHRGYYLTFCLIQTKHSNKLWYSCAN